MKTSFTRLVDDLDGSTDNVQTYTFTLQGVRYAIDLSDANADTFFAAFAVFIDAGRRVPRRKHTRRTAPDKEARRRSDRLLRGWWAAHWQEFDLPPYREDGPIPKRVRAATGTDIAVPATTRAGSRKRPGTLSTK